MYIYPSMYTYTYTHTHKYTHTHRNFPTLVRAVIRVASVEITQHKYFRWILRVSADTPNDTTHVSNTHVFCILFT